MVEQIKDFTAGAVGGLLVVLSGHPLDTIKVRLQTMPTPAPGQLPMFTGVFHCFKKTVKHEGFYGLYKGMSSRIVAITPHAALSFLGFSIGKEVVSHIKNEQTTKLSLPELFWAGSIAGFFTVFIVTPSERIKCLLQIQKGAKEKIYEGPVDCAKKLYCAGGIQSLYRGIVLTLARGILFNGMYFASYEGIKQALITPSEKEVFHFGEVESTLIAGGIAGLLGWTAAICPDVLKSRFQTAPTGKYNGTVDVFRDVLRTDGFRGMYKGIAPVLLRAFPANACCFLGYESTKKILDKYFPPS